MESLKKKIGYTLKSYDKSVGRIKDFIINDKTWNVKYIVTEIGNWPNNRSVLIPSQILKCSIDNVQRTITCDFPEDMFCEFPTLDEKMPVSLEQQKHFEEKSKWAVDLKNQLAQTPVPDQHVKDTLRFLKKKTDNSLRSLTEIKGYTVYTKSGNIGKMEDVIFNPESWEMNYIVAHSKKLFDEKRILVSTEWITGISWVQAEVKLGLDAEELGSKLKPIPTELKKRKSMNRIKEFFIK